MAKIIDVTPDERRRDWRRTIVLDALLDGHPIKILDVSFGGVGGAIEIVGQAEYHPELGRILPLSIESERGNTITFEVEIIRLLEPNGVFGARFTSLNDEQFRAVERLTMGRSL